MNSRTIILNLVSWVFGIIFFAIGVLNMFWGNDTLFGVFLALLSLMYFPPLNTIFKKMTGFSIPAFVKVIIGVFIVWASLGVGELFGKIELMMKDLS